MEAKQINPWEYCRFCAELISSSKLMKIDHTTLLTLAEVCEKLHLLRLEIYTENNENLLIKVCFICWNNFNTAFEFCETFRKAQDRFRELQLKNQLDTVKPPEFEKFYCFNDHKADKNPSNDDEEGEDNQPLIYFQSKLHSKINELPTETSPIEVKIEDNCETKSWSDYSWLCKICKAVLPDIQTLRDHSTSEHLLCPQFVCIDCEKYKYRSFNRFISHVMTHRKHLKNVCIYCGKYSSTPRKHLKSHYSFPKAQCDTCGEVFSNELSIERHQLMYNPFFERTTIKDMNNEKDVPNNCSKKRLKETSIDESKLLNKECENANENQSVSNTICGDNNGNTIKIDEKSEMELKKMVSLKCISKPIKKTIRKAYRSRLRLKTEELTCNECQNIFNNQTYLLHHRLKVHGIDDRPDLVCDQCAKIFKTEMGLKSHVENHDRKKLHQCKLCTKSFTQITHLRTHVKSHLGMKPFECDLCQKRFSGRSFLNSHIKIAHSANWFPCKFCSKKFKSKHKVKHHEMIHTGEKPFVCPECGMRFNNYPNCTRHAKRRHNVNLAKSKYTPDGPLPLDPVTGKVVELLDAATCPDWTKDLFAKKYKRSKKKD